MRSSTRALIAAALLSAATAGFHAPRQPRTFGAVDTSASRDKLRGKPWSSKKAKRRKA
jgi:hypothetical protein